MYTCSPATSSPPIVPSRSVWSRRSSRTGSSANARWSWPTGSPSPRPLGVRALKAGALTYVQHGGEQAAIEAIPGIRAQVLTSEDFAEGIRSFKERRAARFQGR